MEPTTTGSEPQMEEGSPIDAMLAQVDSYIQNPSMVTPETLNQLKDGLLALKADVEGESVEGAPDTPVEEGSFTGDIQKRMSGGAF